MRLESAWPLLNEVNIWANYGCKSCVPAKLTVQGMHIHWRITSRIVADHTGVSIPALWTNRVHLILPCCIFARQLSRNKAQTHKIAEALWVQMPFRPWRVRFCFHVKGICQYPICAELLQFAELGGISGKAWTEQLGGDIFFSGMGSALNFYFTKLN